MDDFQKLPVALNYETLKLLSFEDLKNLSQTGSKELLGLIKRILKDEKYLSSELTRRIKEDCKIFLSKYFFLDFFNKNFDSEIRTRLCDDGTYCQIEFMFYEGQQMIEKFNISYFKPTHDAWYTEGRMYQVNYINLNDDDEDQPDNYYLGYISSNTLVLLKLFIKLYEEKKIRS